MVGQSEGRGRGSVRSPDGRRRVKGRKRQTPVHAKGFLVAYRWEPAGMPDRRTARFLTARLAPLGQRIRTVIAEAGY